MTQRASVDPRVDLAIEEKSRTSLGASGVIHVRRVGVNVREAHFGEHRQVCAPAEGDISEACEPISGSGFGRHHRSSATRRHRSGPAR
jgi:hypothetical protein